MAYVTLPELGEGITSATVALWHVREGEKVFPGQDIVEMVTDKATFNVPAGQAGQIVKILVKPGEPVKIGEPLVALEI